MMFLDEWRKALQILRSPGENTKKSMSMRAALEFYYKLSVIPGILTIIVAAIGYLINPSLIASGGYGDVSGVFSEVLALLGLWVLTPLINLLALNAWLQFIGRLVKRFNKPYENTLTAAVYGVMPGIMITWISPLFLVVMPSTGAVFTPAYIALLLVTLPFSIWGMIIWIYAMSNQQRTTKLAAVGVWLLSSVLLAVLLMVIIILLAIVLVVAGVIA